MRATARYAGRARRNTARRPRLFRAEARGRRATARADASAAGERRARARSPERCCGERCHQGNLFPYAAKYTVTTSRA